MTGDVIRLPSSWLGEYDDRDLFGFVVQGDWLAPTVRDGECLILAAGETSRPGDRVIAVRDERPVIGRIDSEGLTLADGVRLPLSALSAVLAVIVGRWADERDA